MSKLVVPLVSPALTKLLAKAVCFRERELPAGCHWSLPMVTILCIVVLRLRSRSSQAVLSHARLPLPLRVPLPVRLRASLQLLRLLHNPPHLVGSRLALLPLGHVMTRWGLTRRPAVLSRSQLLVTLPQLG